MVSLDQESGWRRKRPIYAAALTGARRSRHRREPPERTFVCVSFALQQPLKSLAWDRDGFVLYYKRLEVGVFKLPKLAPGTRSVELKTSELAMLLDGIDLSQLKRTPRY
jgi:hypothetical protein